MKTLDEGATSPAYSSGFIKPHEEIEENDEQDDLISTDDDEESADDIFSEEHLPLRAISAFTSMKNGSDISSTNNVTDDDRFSVSDVYTFEIIDE